MENVPTTTESEPPMITRAHLAARASLAAAALSLLAACGDDAAKTEDVVEGIVKHMHVVLPVVGAVLIFLLAFIAVAMA